MQDKTMNISLEKNREVNLESIAKLMKGNVLLFTFLALLIACSILSPKFLTFRNITSLLEQYSIYGIVAMGMLFVIITGGIDLAVGSVVAVSVCFVAGFIQNGMGIMSIPAVLIICTIAGLVTGLIIVYGKVAPFIATLATALSLSGIAYLYQVGANRRIDGTFLPRFVNSKFLGILPTSFVVMLIIVLISAFILTKTTFGRSVYAIGGNQETSRLAGINVKRVTIMVYGLSGLLSGIGGILLAGRLSMGTALVGDGYEMDAIAAVVVGGATLSGGKGSAMQTLIGTFFIGVIMNIMNLMHVAPYPQMIIRGLIILAAVLIRRK